jgi:hypothetical protein
MALEIQELDLKRPKKHKKQKPRHPPHKKKKKGGAHATKAEPIINPVNSELYYKSDKPHSRGLWVMEISQGHELSGSAYQSRTKRHFYPRSYAPGDIVVKGRCSSQEQLQTLSLFIRMHQRAIMAMPRNQRFARINTSSPGYQRLLRLSIPSERLLVRGWVSNFSIIKKGVFDPAPEYTFNFFVVFDNTAQNIALSHRIRRFYDAADYAFATVNVPEETPDRPKTPEDDDGWTGNKAGKT